MMPDISRPTLGAFARCALAALLLSAALPSLAATSAPATPADAAIAWQHFAPAAFRRAIADGRPVLLVLDAPWSDFSKLADEQTWNHPDVVRIVREAFVPIRERADERPDLLRRYPAEGWPAITLLLPDGSPLFYVSQEAGAPPRRMTVGPMPGEGMARVLSEALAYFRSAPAARVKVAVEQDAKMRETARPTPGPLDEPLVWTIAQSARTTFDPERRYFGGPPRLPRFDIVEFMLTLGGEDETWRVMGTAALDTITAKLVDPADGGMYRMAGGLDWEDPHKEKLLDRNARLLDAQALAFRATGRRTYRDQALKTAAFLTGKLGLADGSFANAACAHCPGGRDELVVSEHVAQAAVALIHAGAVFEEPPLVERGLAAARFLKDKRFRPARGVPRIVENGEGILPVHLDDLAETTLAFLAAYEVGGGAEWLAAAGETARFAIDNLREPRLGALRDIIAQPGAPAPAATPLYPIEGNSRMARALVRLFWLGGDKRYREAAYGVLRAFAGSYERTPLLASGYGQALYEYHLPPIRVAVVGRPGDAGADALRRAALGCPFPYVVVRTLDPAADREKVLEAGLTITQEAALYGFYGDELTGRVAEPGGVRAELAELRERHVAALERTKAKAKPKPEDK
nr:thioredoxin domain-containing protein [Acidobacteriota bacterium]